MALVDVMADHVAQAALAGLRLAVLRPAFKPVQLAVSAEMAEWLLTTGRPAVAALGRPLETIICLNNGDGALSYIIDRSKDSH